MNGNLELVEQVKEALQSNDLTHVDVLVCPPYPYLAAFGKSNLLLGGQNLSEYASGAHTGEISASMLSDVGCQYVIVGHSERRTDNGESNTEVARKVKAALSEKLVAVLCVGEPESVRDEGTFFDYIAAQLDAVLDEIGIASFEHVVLAYEPVWAIGTGKTASPEQAQEVHQFIRAHLAVHDADVAQKILILYGGSVKPANAAELFGQPDVDGGLIGGASLDPQDFLHICLATKA